MELVKILITWIIGVFVIGAVILCYCACRVGGESDERMQKLFPRQEETDEQ